MIRNIEGWNNFTKDLEIHILPHYQNHEATFDPYGIHGRRHITRAVLFSELMARFYNDLGLDVDFNGIRHAIAFHDSGRQGNGIDLWESDSADLCYSYLGSNGLNEEYSYHVSRFIEKHGDWSINKQIVQDADVLEIMRVICDHGGRDGFLPDRLRFLSSKDVYIPKHKVEQFSKFRNDLIEDAWKFIEHTENNRHLFSTKNNDHLQLMIEMLDKKKNEYSVLKKLVE